MAALWQQMTTPQHHIIKETSESLSRLLQDEFKRNGYKRVHIVEQAPKPEAIRRQAARRGFGLPLPTCRSIPKATILHVRTAGARRSARKKTDRSKSSSRRRRLWVRLDYSDLRRGRKTTADEQLLLGLMIRTVMNECLRSTRDQAARASRSKTTSRSTSLMSARLDEGTLARFWGSPEPAGAAGDSPSVDGRADSIRRSSRSSSAFKCVSSEYKSMTEATNAHGREVRDGNPFLGSRRCSEGSSGKK